MGGLPHPLLNKFITEDTLFQKFLPLVIKETLYCTNSFVGHELVFSSFHPYQPPFIKSFALFISRTNIRGAIAIDISS